jgi:hypothetical protein
MARRPDSRQTALKGQAHDSQSNSTFYRQDCICHWRYKRHRTGDRDCVCNLRKADDVTGVIVLKLGQILLPARDEGHNLQSTSMAIKPGTKDLYIVTSDGNGGQGATIFHAKVFAKALPLYSHQ